VLNVSVSGEAKGKLERALDSVDYAIDLLRDAADADQVLAELLEDILYHLEEAADALSALIEKRRGVREKA
jgi:predicted ribosome quality control (RQC) complex YloA/Tae2 family protein